MIRKKFIRSTILLFKILKFSMDIKYNLLSETNYLKNTYVVTIVFWTRFKNVLKNREKFSVMCDDFNYFIEN